MATEASRGLVRMLSNYGRLGTTLIIGLIYVPLVLMWLGEAAFGLLTLMGASVGIAAMASEISRKSMLRELAAAHHGADEGWFRGVYNSAYVVSFGAASLTAILFSGLLLALPLLKIPEHLMGAARWLVVAEGVAICLQIFLQPALNMYVVREWFVLENLWHALRRVSMLGAIIVLSQFVGITDPAVGLASYAMVNLAGQVLCILVPAALIMVLDRRLRPRPGAVSRRAMREVVGTFGLQTGVTVATSIHERITQLIMNLLFGVLGNMIYGIGLRLSAYVALTTAGVTTGLEAVSARLHADESRDGAVRSLLYHTTRLHTFVTIPAGLLAFVLAEPIIVLWLGRALEDPATTVPVTVMTVHVLMFALVSKAISEGWIAVLYGAGHLRRYAPLIVAGGFINPVLIGVMLLVVPEAATFYAPAMGYAITLTVVHLMLLPIVVARCLGLTYGQVVMPMLRPALVALGCGVIPVYAQITIEEWTLLDLAMVGGAYGVTYGGISWFLVLDAAERQRFGGAIMRRLAALRTR